MSAPTLTLPSDLQQWVLDISEMIGLQQVSEHNSSASVDSGMYSDSDATDLLVAAPAAELLVEQSGGPGGAGVVVEDQSIGSAGDGNAKKEDDARTESANLDMTWSGSVDKWLATTTDDVNFN